MLPHSVPVPEQLRFRQTGSSIIIPLQIRDMAAYQVTEDESTNREWCHMSSTSNFATTDAVNVSLFDLAELALSTLVSCTRHQPRLLYSTLTGFTLHLKAFLNGIKRSAARRRHNRTSVRTSSYRCMRLVLHSRFVYSGHDFILQR